MDGPDSLLSYGLCGRDLDRLINPMIDSVLLWPLG